MAVLRFEPIATQLGKLASPAKLFPREVLDRIQQGVMEGADPAWSPELEEFMLHYTAVVQAAHLLLGAPPFDRLARIYEAQEKRYQPGGPPMSPVYDSYSVQHILAEVPQGLAGETPYGVLARLSSGDPARARLCELAQALAVSHLELYRVTLATGLIAELLPVRGGSAFSVQLSGPFLRTGDRALARVLAFGGGHFIADSPYLLEAPESEWLEYFERVAREREAPKAAARPAAASNAKLSPKHAARRRKEQRQKASQHTPREVVSAHLRHGDDESFWLEFILDAYAGERRGIVRLAGVPDRPESLPHSEQYTPPVGEKEPLTALQRVRRALMAIARREGILEREGQALSDVSRRLGVKEVEPHEADRNLLMAYCTLAARSEQGMTALELLCREQELDPEQRAVVGSLERGHFSVLRVEQLQPDQGLELLDLLRGDEVRVQESAATRQLGLGDLVLGWLCVTGEGVCSLEGGIVHVPALVAPAVSELSLGLFAERRAEHPDETPAQRGAAVLLPLLAGIQYLRENFRLPAR
jgi:hypothetical protein